MGLAKNAIMMIGLPGCGKSTLVQLINCCDQYEIMSLDNIIEEYAAKEGKTYSDVFDSHVVTAGLLLETRVSKAISSGVNIIFDQTNLSAYSRHRRIRELSYHNYNIVAIVITEQESVISERLRLRGELTGKIIPESVISSMKSRFEFPSFSEGFNKIIHLDSGQLK